ncbi:MAG: folate-binding protein YgfZ [Immundisolibacteraceae bacterium]|nr:folate-binding protein YgfZ [Immundisolibacteraceae bacterium]
MLKIALLNHLGILNITGEDAASFLQSQLTNDANQLSKDSGQISGYCNHKGRLLGLFQLIATDTGFLAITPSEVLESLTKRLQMFVMRSSVTLKNLTESDGVASIWGDDAASWLAGRGFQAGAEHYSCRQSTKFPLVTLVRQPGDTDSFLLLGPKQQLAEFFLESTEKAPAFSHENDWKLETINNGQPTVVTATSDAFIPQMINLDLINGVSFQKGCYPGQEIVARTRYLGKLKKRMMLFEIDADNSEPVPVAGDPIMAEGNEQSVGTVVDASILSGGHYRLLAVIRLAALEKPLSVNGLELSLLELPYAFPTEAEAT